MIDANISPEIHGVFRFYRKLTLNWQRLHQTHPLQVGNYTETKHISFSLYLGVKIQNEI